MLPGNSVAIEKNCKKVLHEEHSRKTIGLRLLLSVYIVKKVQWKLWIIVRNGHYEDNAFHTSY